ncbi:hypothetical protein PGB90_002075 [Kerria lacca]
MLILFFDSEGLIHKEFVPAGQTVNAALDVTVLDRLLKRIGRVRPQRFANRDFVLLHDNAPAYTEVLEQQFVTCKSVPVLSHPPYSPDLSPSDYFLFPKLKLELKESRFDTIEDIHAAVTAKLNQVPTEAFVHAMDDLKTLATRCINLNGVYFE